MAGGLRNRVRKVSPFGSEVRYTHGSKMSEQFPKEYRLGDTIDDFCVKCKRLTNHSIVSLVEAYPVKVRCQSCYSDHDFLKEIAPPPKPRKPPAPPKGAIAVEATAVEAAVAEAPPLEDEGKEPMEG